MLTSVGLCGGKGSLEGAYILLLGKPIYCLALRTEDWVRHQSRHAGGGDVKSPSTLPPTRLTCVLASGISGIHLDSHQPNVF